MYNCGICGGIVELLESGQTKVNHNIPCVVKQEPVIQINLINESPLLSIHGQPAAWFENFIRN